MSITPTRTYEQIKEQVGPVTGKPAGAWWVGTDKTLPMRDTYHEKWKNQREEIKALAEEHDCDTAKVWVSSAWGSVWFTGFTPNDLTNPHKALRLDTQHSSDQRFVPNKRTKAGKDLARRMDEINNSPEAPNLRKDFTGYTGMIMRPMSDGRHWQSELTVTSREDFYPFLSVSENPDDNPFAQGVEVDPDLWERVPASWLMRIIEESEQEEAGK